MRSQVSFYQVKGNHVEHLVWNPDTGIKSPLVAARALKISEISWLEFTFSKDEVSINHSITLQKIKHVNRTPVFRGELGWTWWQSQENRTHIRLCLRPFLDLVEVCVEVSKAVHSCLDLCQTRAIPQLIFLATKKKNVPFCSTGLLMLDSTVDNGLRYLSGFWSQLSNPQQNGVKVKPFTLQELEGLCMPEDYPSILFLSEIVSLSCWL